VISKTKIRRKYKELIGVDIGMSGEEPTDFCERRVDLSFHLKMPLLSIYEIDR